MKHSVLTLPGVSLLHRGPPGDLFVYLDIEEIPEIQRDGINLLSTISISYLDAILGTVTKVHVSTYFPQAYCFQLPCIYAF